MDAASPEKQLAAAGVTRHDLPADRPRGLLFGRLRLLGVADATAATARKYLLKGLIYPRELSEWWGAPKCGKSFLLLRLAYGLAVGRGMWGRRHRPCRVLYVAAEGEGGFAARLLALRDELGDARDAFQYIAQRATIGPPSEDLASIIQAATHMSAELVVLDTVARVFGTGDESKTPDMSAFVAACDDIREQTNAHVALIHHATRTGTNGRGSSALDGAADAIIRVEKGKDGEPSTATIADMKDSPSGDVLPFHLRVVGMGTDEDGEPVTTCIAEEAEAPAARRPAKKLAAGAGAVLEALQSLFAEGHGRPETPFPNGPTVTAIALAKLRQRLIRQAWFEEHHFKPELSDALPEQRVLNDAGYKAEGKALKVLAEARIIGKARPDGKKGDVLLWLLS
jgi:hypothetical protein